MKKKDPIINTFKSNTIKSIEAENTFNNEEQGNNSFISPSLEILNKKIIHQNQEAESEILDKNSNLLNVFRF